MQITSAKGILGFYTAKLEKKNCLDLESLDYLEQLQFAFEYVNQQSKDNNYIGIDVVYKIFFISKVMNYMVCQ